MGGASVCGISSFLEVIDLPVDLPIEICIFNIYGTPPWMGLQGNGPYIHSVKHVNIHFVSFWAFTVGDQCLNFVI